MFNGNILKPCFLGFCRILQYQLTCLAIGLGLLRLMLAQPQPRISTKKCMDDQWCDLLYYTTTKSKVLSEHTFPHAPCTVSGPVTFPLASSGQYTHLYRIAKPKHICNIFPGGVLCITEKRAHQAAHYLSLT